MPVGRPNAPDHPNAFYAFTHLTAREPKKKKRSANPADAHFVGQAALFNELGVQIMQDAFTRGACVCACVYLAGCDGWWMALHLYVGGVAR